MAESRGYGVSVTTKLLELAAFTLRRSPGSTFADRQADVPGANPFRGMISIGLLCDRGTYTLGVGMDHLKDELMPRSADMHSGQRADLQ